MSYYNASRRTFQKVHADSFVLGGFESEVFRPYDRDEMAMAIEAAERFDVRNKPKGARNGPIGHVGVEIYRALWQFANFRDGRCDPSLRGLMKATGRSRRAVVEALKRLWNVGLVRWIRRFVYTGKVTARCPQVEQATNAYELRYLGAGFLALLSPAQRARYRPKRRPSPAPAPRERGKKTAMQRVGAAWGRMGAAIRDHLGATALAKLEAAGARLADAERESTEGDQTSPTGDSERLVDT